MHNYSIIENNAFFITTSAIKESPALAGLAQ